MSSFTKKLITEYIDGRDFAIHEPFAYRIGDENSQVVVNVPVGYVTDFASTPRFIWSILPPTGKYGKAAVVHDFLCRYHKIMNGAESVYVSRQQGDDIFYEAMKVLNVPAWQRNTMYFFVRAYAVVKGYDRVDYGQNADTDAALAPMYAGL